MARDIRQLAKLTRPRIHGIVPRERLFDLIDRRRQRPVVWVVAPPGAGKTALVASYLEARESEVLWYDMDSGDADPATFFYYLQQAAGGAASPKRGLLPLLTPEYLPDLPGFARRFFRELYGRLPESSVVVFDNYHEVPPDSPLHSVVEQAFSQLPQGINAIVVSRAQPPGQFSRHVANGFVAQIDYGDLRLTFEETGSVAAGNQPLDEASLRTLYTQAGGWAAGTILMLERLKHTGEINFLSKSETLDTVFNYFAGQIFGDLSATAHEVLLHTSFLPRVSAAMAAEITGNAAAGQVLEDLYRGHLFTERRIGDEITYHYHALFRAFLLAKATERYTPSGLAQLRRRAARLLEANGNFDDAIAIYQQAHDWSAAARLILKQAPLLHARGRVQTLMQWINAMPDDVVEAAPRLLCDLGLCHGSANPSRARHILERAFGLMRDLGDGLGQATAVTGIVETYYLEWTDFKPLDRWIVELERLLAQRPAFPSPETELRAYCGMLIATLSRQPQHAMLPLCATAIERLLDAGVEVNLAVKAGAFLLHYYSRFDVNASERIIARIAPLLSRHELTPLNHVVWLGRYARYCAYFMARFEDAEDCFRQAHALMDQAGLQYYESILRAEHLLVGMAAMDIGVLQPLIAKMETEIAPSRQVDLALVHLARSRVALHHDDLAQADWHVREGLAIAIQAGAVTVQSVFLMFLAETSSELRDADGVRASLKDMRASFPVAAFAFLDYLAHAHEARLAVWQGRRDEARELVRAALEIARRERFLNMNWCPRVQVWLCEFAVENQIEVDFIRARINTCGVVPVSPDIEGWPWPIRICTLERFSVEVDGAPLVFSGKAPKKPLDLLKALIALGGRDVDFMVLMGVVWPDSTGDAQKSFEMAVARLRKLLGRNDAVLTQHGKVSLNRHLVWVDAWAFERLVPDADEPVAGDAAMEMEACASRAFQLYNGRFMEHEIQAPWMRAMADRLQAKFLRLVLTLGQSREATNWETAAEVYARGLEFDNLSEELYRRLMICHRARGEVAAAMNVYRRCRENLSIILGVAPSVETVAVYNSLLQ